MENTNNLERVKQAARGAFSGTSFSPEKREASAIDSYEQSIADFREFIGALNDKHPDCSELWAEERRKFEDKHTELMCAYLHSHGNVMSSMITGPSNFPTARNQKRSEWADNHMNRLLEHPEIARANVSKKARKIEVEAQGGELAIARKKLETEMATHEAMKEANKIIRSKPRNESTPEKVEKLTALEGISAGVARLLFRVDGSDGIGFASFHLTNTNNRIKSTRARVAELERRETAETTETKTESGVQIVENAEEDRLQLLFAGKPSDEIRGQLKRNGFHWSRRFGAWQRQLTDNARRATAQLVAGGVI